MAIFGKLSTIRTQVAQTPAFKAAFDYLEEALRPDSETAQRLAQLKAGDNNRIELAHGAFAMEQAYLGKLRDDPAAKWESHKKYIDVQAIITGTERMDVTETAKLQVTEDGTPAKDFIFYAPFANASVLRVEPGEVAIFFPADAHLPSLTFDKVPTLARKTVVKVPVGA